MKNLLIISTLVYFCFHIEAKHNSTTRTLSRRFVISNGTRERNLFKFNSSEPSKNLSNLIVNQWETLERTSQKFALRLSFQNLLPTFDQLFDKNNISPSCQSALLKLSMDVTKLKRYAIQMVDSSGKFPPSGIMEGTLTDLGRFDECLAIDEILEGDEDLVMTRIKGQYCSINIRPPLPKRPRFHTLCNQLSELVNISNEGSAFRWLGKHAQYFYYTPIRIGLCTPSQCSVKDVNRMISKLSSSFNLTGSVVGMKCDVTPGYEASLTKSQLLCSIFFILIFLVVITGTILDIFGIGEFVKISSSTSDKYSHNWNQQELEMLSRVDQSIYNSRDNGTSSGQMFWVNPNVSGAPVNRVEDVKSTPDNDSLSSEVIIDCSQWIKIMKCFSFKRNASRILNLDSDTSKTSLSVVHGLRVFTMAWIILGHTYGLVNPQLHSHAFSAQAMYTNFWFQGLLNATLSVDTFFFISGLLTVYVSWKKLSKKKSVPAIPLTCLRYLRLTPPYLSILALTFIFPLLSSGPVWRETVDPIVDACSESWWTNLLYINNFVKTEKLCLMHSWYLSNDMQMHIFSLFFLYLLFKSKMLAFLFLSSSMAACTAYSAVQTFVNDFPPTIISTSPVVEDRWNYILDYYYKPWPHLPSYCIGLCLGYVMAAKLRVELSASQNRICWTFISILSFVVLYGVYPWNMGWKISPEVTAIYSSTFRTLWTLCCAWTTYALLTQNQGCFMAKILSWKGLLPFSRLTYMAFLIHPFVIWLYTGSMRERFTASHFNYFHLFLGHYILTYIISFFFGVCFESPFMSVLKLLFNENTQKDNKRPRHPPNVVHLPTESLPKTKTREFIYYHMAPTTTSYSP